VQSGAAYCPLRSACKAGLALDNVVTKATIATGCLMKCLVAVWLVMSLSAISFVDSCAAGERFSRIPDDGESPIGNGVLLFSQIKSNKKDLLWGFQFGRPGEKYRYLAGREVRFPNGFYEIGCGRVGSVTAISLPPGSYELGPWKIDGAVLTIGPIWSVGKNHKPQEEKRFTIEIRADEVTYAGEFDIDEANGNSATISDKFDCEREYLARTWSWMTGLPLTKAESISLRQDNEAGSAETLP
jgi:hypothetical protein